MARCGPFGFGGGEFVVSTVFRSSNPTNFTHIGSHGPSRIKVIKTRYDLFKTETRAEKKRNSMCYGTNQPYTMILQPTTADIT